MSIESSSARVKSALAKLGREAEIATFPSSTRSAADAAQSIGCQVDQIAKSIIFKAGMDECVLVILSGSQRVSLTKVGELLGQKIEKADADFVRLKTGFAIGGVPPVGHSQSVKVIVDSGLAAFPFVWAAAGTPHSVFRTSFDELCAMTNAQVASVSE